MTTRKAHPEPATLVRRILAAVDMGEIEADTSAGRRLRHRLEGAVIGLEAGGGGTTEEPEGQIVVVERHKGST